MSVDRTADIERAAQLLADHPDMSQRTAAAQVGINESTLRDGLRRLRLDAGRDAAGTPSNGDPADELLGVPIAEIPVIHRDYSALEELYVYPMSDVHKGSAAHNQPRWLEWLAYIEDTPTASLLANGDLMNTGIAGSKSSVYEERMTVQEAKWELHDELTPVADRIDAMNPGNHEQRVTRLTGEDPVYDLARTLGVPYFKAAAILVYHVGDVEYEVLVRHGTGGGGKTVGSKANNLEYMARIFQADAYVMGHTHTQLAFPQEVFVREGAVVRRRKQYFIGSGSFLNYEDYAAEKGMPPTKIGAPRMRLDGRRKDMHVSI